MNTQQSLQIHTFELDTLKQSSCGQVTAGGPLPGAASRVSPSAVSTSPTFLVMEPKRDQPQGWYREPAARGAQECPLLMNTGSIFIVTSQNSLMSFSYLGAPAQVKVTWIHSEARWYFCQLISMAFFPVESHTKILSSYPHLVTPFAETRLAVWSS